MAGYQVLLVQAGGGLCDLVHLRCKFFRAVGVERWLIVTVLGVLGWDLRVFDPHVRYPEPITLQVIWLERSPQSLCMSSPSPPPSSS